MENFESKYFNLDSFGPDWNKDELIPILKFLESVDINTLQDIVTECGVTFNGGNKNVNDREQLINVLFGHDVAKNKLIEKIKEYL